MSIRNNTIANYIGQIYLVLIGLVITPFYLIHLGDEAYGLVGFFLLLQTWLNLLDIGITPTLARQVAYARSQINGFDEFRKLLKSFELIFITLALVVTILVACLSDWLANEWVNSEILSTSTITYAISLMGIMIGFRWLAGLYRSGIVGLEDQVWLNFASIVLTTLKFVGSLILLVFISKNIVHFFIYQLSISFLELLTFMARFYSRLPPLKAKLPLFYFNFPSVKSVAPFALGIAYTAGLWVFVVQVDKLVLSGVLSLAEFGFLSLVVIVAGAINLLSGPISQAVQPRMTYLLSRGKEVEMILLYRGATQLVTLISLSAALIVSFYSEPLMFAWTGNKDASKWAGDVLFWYALGNGALAILGFQYYLQVAHGKLKLHVLSASLSAVIDIPIMIYASLNFGAEGAGIAWFVLRVSWLLLWTPIVHHKFAYGIHWKWLINDVSIITVVLLSWVTLIQQMFNIESITNRWLIFLVLLVIGLSTIVVGVMASSFIRQKIFKIIREKYASS